MTYYVNPLCLRALYRDGRFSGRYRMVWPGLGTLTVRFR